MVRRGWNAVSFSQVPHELRGLRKVADALKSRVDKRGEPQSTVVGARARHSIVHLQEVHRSDVLPLQMVPGAAFQNLVPRAGGGGAIGPSSTWVRPAWLRGAAQGARTIRNEIAAARGPDRTIEGIAFYRCGLCGHLATINGFSADHIQDWKAWCEQHGAIDQQTLEATYHDLDNLRLVHNNCNSSKGVNDLFDWWKSSNALNYLEPESIARIRGALARIFDDTGYDWAFELPENARRRVLDGIIQQGAPEVNAFGHLMGNAKILSGLNTWPKSEPERKGEHDDDRDDMIT
jgi:hypothetical protein